MPVKVLRTTPSFYPHVTGPAYQAYRISKGLVELGHDSPIITSDVLPAHEEPGYPPEMEAGAEFPFDVTRRKSILSIDQYWFSPGAAIDGLQNEYDIVHAHGYYNAIKDILYCTSKLIRDKPFIVHLHGALASPSEDPTLERTVQYDLYNKIFKRTVENADAVVASSKLEKQEATNFGIQNDKVVVIPAGKNPKTYTKFPKKSNNKFTILFVGRLASRRNVEMILQTVTNFNQRELHEIEVRIIGGEAKVSGATKEYLPKLRKFCKEEGISDIIEFTGPKYGDELIKEYRSADVFVNPSHYENFGQATLEAAFAGLPLLATPTGIAPELIKEGQNGFLIEDKSNLLEYLYEYYNDKQLLAKHGENSQKLANRRFTWSNIINKYEKLYEEIISKYNLE